MNVQEESKVLKILDSACIPREQIDSSTAVNDGGRVIKLRLTPCFDLKKIPATIGDLFCLEEVYIFWASRLLTDLPLDGFGRLYNLRILQIRYCKGLKRLPSDLGLSELGNNLEELIIEGCDDIIDLSCFRTAKNTWKKLQRLKIAQVGADGINSLIQALSSTEEYDYDNDNIGNSKDQLSQVQHETSSSSSILFPSLTCLSLKKNSIDQTDVVNLWPFFRRCPRLIRIDLGDNQISSVEDLVPTATTTTSLLPPMALREINLAGNPIARNHPDNHNDNDNTGVRNHDGNADAGFDTDENIIHHVGTEVGTEKSYLQQVSRQREYLLSIITSNPNLVSILLCDGSCHNGNNDHIRCLRRRRCNCFQNSALYSPKIRHALDINQCSKRMTLMATTRPILPPHDKRGDRESTALFSLCLWPLVLERTNQSTNFFPLLGDSSLSSSLCRCEDCRECSSRDGDDTATIRSLGERQASVLYSLLHGPVFAARGDR
jgi:hypothetical protein